MMLYRIMHWSGIVFVASIVIALVRDVIGPGAWRSR